MRRCDDCQIILDSNVRFCPKCGKQVGPDGSPSAASQRDINALLASANLHRIRQEWDAATADATEALRVDPKNPDIASILADIYEQRGKLDDAMIWCQMSLELNPDSAPEQARLERIRKRSAVADSAANPDGFRVFQRRTMIGALVMVGVIIFIGVLALVMRNRTPEMTIRPANEGRERTPIINPGYATPNNPSSSSVPYTTTPRSSTMAPLTGGQAASSGSGVRTYGEAQIKSEMQGVQQNGMRVDDAIVDPRQGVLVVTFTVAPEYASRNSIIDGAGALARAVFKSNREVNFVTARCLISSSDANATQLAFVGDVARTSLDSIGSNPDPNLVAKAFTNQWWNQTVK